MKWIETYLGLFTAGHASVCTEHSLPWIGKQDVALSGVQQKFLFVAAQSR